MLGRGLAMITIELQPGLTATWDTDELKWTCKDPLFSSVLNNSVPAFSVGDLYREDGRQGLALVAARKVLKGFDLKVLKHTAEPEPGPELLR